MENLISQSTPHTGAGSLWTTPKVAVCEVFLAFVASDCNGCAQGWVSGRRQSSLSTLPGGERRAQGKSNPPRCRFPPVGQRHRIFDGPRFTRNRRACYPSNTFFGP